MNKELLKKWWKHPRWHSLMVLIIWIISLALLIGTVSIVNLFAPKKEIPKQEKIPESFKTYEEKWLDLLDGDYTFTYLIKQENDTIKYEGTKINEIINGYRERKDGIIKYEISKGKTYQILIDDKVEITNLYENIDENFLSISYWYERLNENRIRDTLEESPTTIYEYLIEKNEEIYTIQVLFDDLKIQSIHIQFQNKIYNLTFNLIGV